MVLFVVHPHGGYFQNQWERNVATAEEYILEGSALDIVIVGSSLAASMEKDDLGFRFRNISFVGGSAQTGLEIIRRCRPMPRVVLVETNVLWHLDTAFVEARFAPFKSSLKRYIPSARTINQPVNLLLSALNIRDGKEDFIPDAKVFATLLAKQMQMYQQTDDLSLVRTWLAAVAEAVEELKARGVKVVFFRMPVDPSIEESPRVRRIQEEYTREFPPSHFAWLEVPHGGYLTSDGVHLVPQCARDFSGKLRRALELSGY